MFNIYTHPHTHILVINLFFSPKPPFSLGCIDSSSISLNFSGNTNSPNASLYHCHSPSPPLHYHSVSSEIGPPPLNMQRSKFQIMNKINLTLILRFSYSKAFHVLLWFWDPTFLSYFSLESISFLDFIIFNSNAWTEKENLAIFYSWKKSNQYYLAVQSLAVCMIFHCGTWSLYL